MTEQDIPWVLLPTRACQMSQYPDFIDTDFSNIPEEIQDLEELDDANPSSGQKERMTTTGDDK